MKNSEIRALPVGTELYYAHRGAPGRKVTLLDTQMHERWGSSFGPKYRPGVGPGAAFVCVRTEDTGRCVYVNAREIVGPWEEAKRRADEKAQAEKDAHRARMDEYSTMHDLAQSVVERAAAIGVESARVVMKGNDPLIQLSMSDMNALINAVEGEGQ